ncbi:hypothetical protein BGL34_03595 [Fructilactobacillus lindneri]|nr:hypothetical protein [Fructilactobacillus lindneri]ANZ57794.1 hypothetical protein AYR60_02935 [Fructilactobacillus lindneri]ANZ59063.1 hypothetical protein AYR59_02935 [Fructilactobacillus lindneri]POG98116.1 hypothetical protein BGL31_03265 [Fructilactobacillus lindneri]POH01769.1 hypothetical protein BGL32_04165 [Fructilactobacillus lindneri]POH03613.1 hypothetical protein BGL33_03050 [Fructilactobacillus lindneri]
MIMKALKDGYESVKKHFGVILGMWLPVLIVSLFGEGLLNSAGSGFLSMTNPGFYLFLTCVTLILGTLFTVSFQYGLLKSDQDGKFEFKRAFVAFDGLTWIGIIVISFLVGLIGFLFIFFFGLLAGGFLFSAVTEMNYAMIAVAAVITIIGGLAYLFIALSLYFVFFTYFTDTKGTDDGIFKAFPKTWKLMKGHRWQLLGLLVIEWLIELVVAIVLAMLSAIVIWLVLMITSFGIKVAVGAILGLVVFVIGLVAFVSLTLWFSMTSVKFFEALNK